MAKDENTNGNIPPINNPAITTGSLISKTNLLIIGLLAATVSRKAANNARAVRAAEPIAKPLPIAAVVLPTASSLSVLPLTSAGNSAISAQPPALSAIGP